MLKSGLDQLASAVLVTVGWIATESMGDGCSHYYVFNKVYRVLTLACLIYIRFRRLVTT